MRPLKLQKNNQYDLFRQRLDSIINMRHELILRVHRIEWDQLDTHFGKFFSENGCSGTPSQMMIGSIFSNISLFYQRRKCVRGGLKFRVLNIFVQKLIFNILFPLKDLHDPWRKRMGDEVSYVSARKPLCSLSSQSLEAL